VPTSPELTARPLFADWTLATQWGATPAFAWPGLRATATPGVPHEDWPGLWRAARAVAKRFAAEEPALATWLAALEAADPTDEAFDPLIAGWRALSDALALPAYPAVAMDRLDGARSWYLALPYRQIGALALELLRAWLEIAAAALGRESISLNRQGLDKWLVGHARLRDSLPSPEIAALHHELWRAGIAWQWQGGDNTRIGEGVRQTTVAGGGGPGLWQDPERWRIPSYTVTGSIGKTTTVRLLRQLLADSGARIGATDSDGAWIGEERIVRGDSIGGNAAHSLLRDPRAEAAVLEQGRAGILRHGVPFARSDVGVLLNVHPVHIGLDGVGSIEQLADAKALGIAPARIAVLNRDDPQCRRIGAARAARSVVWFSRSASPDDLRGLSATSHAAAGIARDAAGAPQALVIWRDGATALSASLAGVAPFHGMLGEKTLEELLAAVCAAWAGPLPVTDWEARLRALRLDSANHVFRASVHRRGNGVFVLDKAGEEASCAPLAGWIDALAQAEGARWRIAVLSRAASDFPEIHKVSVGVLFPVFDEFATFDRDDTYETPLSLPCYAPGSIPLLLRDEIERLGDARGARPPVTVLADWDATQAWIDRRLAELHAGLDGPVLILINQPSTGADELNDAILAFVESPATG